MGSVDGACLTATWKELTQPEGAPLARSSHAVAVIGNCKVSWRPDRIMSFISLLLRFKMVA
jgi:hypothetical protein